MAFAEKDYSSADISGLKTAIERTQSVTELSGIKDEVTHRSEPLSAKEVNDFYEGAPSQERLSFCRVLAKRAMVDAENARRKDAGETGLPLGSSVRLTEFTEMPNEGVTLENVETAGKPQVFYKQIAREEGGPFRKSRTVPTDEVAIVIRLNNGTAGSEDGTVVCGIVKQRNGIVEFDSENNIFWTLKEAQYRASMSETRKTYFGSPENGLEKRAFTGRIPASEYFKEYRRQNRHTVSDDMHEWDKIRINKRETWTYEDVKKETLDRVNNDYGELLQEAERRSQEIAQKTVEALEMNADEVKRRAASPIFENYMYLDQAGFLGSDPELKKRYDFILQEQLHIDPQTMELYRAQYLKEREKKQQEETADVQSNGIVEEARIKAKEILDKAKADADRVTKQAELDAAEAKRRREEEERTRIEREKMRQAEQARDAALAKIANLERELSQVKARLKAEADKTGAEAAKAKAIADKLAAMETQMKKLEAQIAAAGEEAEKVATP